MMRERLCRVGAGGRLRGSGAQVLAHRENHVAYGLLKHLGRVFVPLDRDTIDGVQRLPRMEQTVGSGCEATLLDLVDVGRHRGHVALQHQAQLRRCRLLVHEHLLLDDGHRRKSVC